MALIDSGIEEVRVFELNSGVWADGSNMPAPRVAVVRWRSSWSDKFYQVYVNGRYAGITLGFDQRQMIVQLHTSLEMPVRVEVFAVSAAEANIDFSDELDSQDVDSGRVKMTLLRSQSLPIGSTVQIYFDNGTGEIDYNNPFNDSPIRLWPVWQDKAGFGQSIFGFSDFGFDGSAAVGFGKGDFGYGQFGLDADTIEWVSSPLDVGIYKFAVKVVDEKGNESCSCESGEVTVIPAARAAERVSVFSFDKPTNQLVLTVA